MDLKKILRLTVLFFIVTVEVKAQIQQNRNLFFDGQDALSIIDSFVPTAAAKMFLS